MALLMLQAVVSTGAASEGSRGPAFAALSITDAQGVPQNTLDESNLQVFVIVDPGGEPESMTLFINPPIDRGCYRLSLFAGDGNVNWEKGDYLLGFAAKTAQDAGQTVALLTVSS